MANKFNDFENTGVADGGNVTIANSGTGGQDAFDEVEKRGTATIKYDTDSTKVINDTRACDFEASASGAAGSTNNICWVGYNTSYTNTYFRAYVVLASEPTEHMTIVTGNKGTGDRKIRWRVVIKPDGRIELRDRNNAVIRTSTSRLGFGSRNRIEGSVRIHATSEASNVFELKIFASAPVDQTTPTEILTFNGAKVGMPGYTTPTIRFGILTSSGHAQRIWMDRIKVDSASYPGPATLVGETVTWDQIEPFGGGGLDSISVSPNEPGHMIMGLDVAGTEYSTDGGELWHRWLKGVSNDAHMKAASVGAFDDPRNPGVDTVYFAFGGAGANGVVSRADVIGGDWTHLSTTMNFEGQQADIAGLPGRPRSIDRLAVMDTSSNLPFGYMYAGSYNEGVFRSTDLGATWTNISMASGTNGATGVWCIRGICLDPNDKTTLYVGVYNNNGVGGCYRLTGIRTGTGKTPTLLSPAAIERVEDICFVEDTMYTACGQDRIYKATSPYTSGNWTAIGDSHLSSTSQWTSIDGYLNGSAHRLLVTCYAPVRVDANGTPGATSGNRYGSGYICANGDAASPVFTYVTDPGSSGFPGGGDQDITVNDLATGVRFWRADEDPNTILGRSASGTSAGFVGSCLWNPHSSAGSSKEAWILGSGGAVYKSFDNGLTWQTAFDGIAIASNHSISLDPLRPDAIAAGNMDLDTFTYHDFGELMVNHDLAGGTTSHVVHVDYEGHYWSTANSRDQADANQGTVYYSGAFPINGNPAFNDISGWSGVRCLGFASGQNGSGNKRVIMWAEGTGLVFTDNNGTSFTTSGGDPLTTETSLNDRAGLGAGPIIWPDITQPYVYFLRRGSTGQAGVYRSTDRGANFTKIWDTSIATQDRQGYIGAPPGSYQTIYISTDATTDNFHRIRNAHTTTAANVANGTNRDIITNVDRANQFAFDQSGRLYILIKENTSNLSKILRINTVPTSGTTLTFDDLGDPVAGLATDDTFQQFAVSDVTSLATDGERIYINAHGTLRGTIN